MSNNYIIFCIITLCSAYIIYPGIPYFLPGFPLNGPVAPYIGSIPALVNAGEEPSEKDILDFLKAKFNLTGSPLGLEMIGLIIDGVLRLNQAQGLNNGFEILRIPITSGLSQCAPPCFMCPASTTASS